MCGLFPPCLTLEKPLLKQFVFIWIYRFLTLPLIVLATPVFVWRMRKRGGYAEGFVTRFGFGHSMPRKREGIQRIWLQAVSLGEMLAMEPLLLELAKDPRKEIVLTATTSTGYAMAKEKYSDLAICIAYFPLDFWAFSHLAWGSIKPDLAVVAETEIWPEYLEQARKRRVKVVVVNGRLSDSGHRSMKRLAGLFRRQIGSLSRVLAGSELDGERFRSIGILAERIDVVGNLKIDADFEPVVGLEERRVLRDAHGLGDNFILLGASTWSGEEEVLLTALKELRKEDPNCKLLIVPRHGERRGEIRQMLKECAGSLRYHFKSDGLPEAEVDIMVCDTHGELRVLTQLADLALIGRSLPPHREGQTPVECGALGVPIVMGAGMSNFRSIRTQLLEVGAAVQVVDRVDAVAVIVELFGDRERRERMAVAGKVWHQANRGAVQRTVEAIDKELAS